MPEGAHCRGEWRRPRGGCLTEVMDLGVGVGVGAGRWRALGSIF